MAFGVFKSAPYCAESSGDRSDQPIASDPAANANVIAVSAAQDRLFAASNRGSYVAIAAPSVEIFLPAPDEKYQMTDAGT
jgi:hypothetical protein